MYNIKWLFQVARQGLSDLVPSLRQAFNDNPSDDRLALVYGQSPRRNIIALALAGVIAGSLIASVGVDDLFMGTINWPAVFVGGAYAMLIRRYLFGTEKSGVEDFPWLAASLVPAAVLLMVVSFVTHLANGGDGDGSTSGFGNLLVAATDALGVAAALTIAVAALCFSRDWPRALWNLALRLVIFRVMVFVTTLIMLDIGFIGPIVANVLQGIFGFHLPEWLPELFDQLGYVALLCVVYLAVIGATWTVCKESFPELLQTGQVNILATIEAMADDPVKRKKKEDKRARKAEKARKAKKK